MVKHSLRKLLDKYPYFLDKRRVSNLYKVTKVNNSVFKDLYNSLFHTYQSFHLNKRLLVWKTQTEPYIYQTHFCCSYPNIKTVQIYKNDVLIHQDEFTEEEAQKRTEENQSYCWDYICNYIKTNMIPIKVYRCTSCDNIYFGDELPVDGFCENCENNTYIETKIFKCNNCDEYYFAEDVGDLNYNSTIEGYTVIAGYKCVDCNELYEELPEECDKCNNDNFTEVTIYKCNICGQLYEQPPVNDPVLSNNYYTEQYVFRCMGNYIQGETDGSSEGYGENEGCGELYIGTEPPIVCDSCGGSGVANAGDLYYNTDTIVISDNSTNYETSNEEISVNEDLEFNHVNDSILATTDKKLFVRVTDNANNFLRNVNVKLYSYQHYTEASTNDYGFVEFPLDITKNYTHITFEKEGYESRYGMKVSSYKFDWDYITDNYLMTVVLYKEGTHEELYPFETESDFYLSDIKVGESIEFEEDALIVKVMDSADNLLDDVNVKLYNYEEFTELTTTEGTVQFPLDTNLKYTRITVEKEGFVSRYGDTPSSYKLNWEEVDGTYLITVVLYKKSIYDKLNTYVELDDFNIRTTELDDIEDFEDDSLKIPFPIIPDDKFLFHVETWDEYWVTKGYPENDTYMDDYYDHDYSLDEIGDLNNIPRKRYIPVDEDNLYPLTEPPFNKSLTEDDYHYMKRMIEYNLRLWASLYILEEDDEEYKNYIELLNEIGISEEEYKIYKNDTRLFRQKYNPVTLELWKNYSIPSTLVNREKHILKLFDLRKHNRNYNPYKVDGEGNPIKVYNKWELDKDGNPISDSVGKYIYKDKWDVVTDLSECWIPEPWEHKDKFCDGSELYKTYFFVEPETLRPLPYETVYCEFKLLNSLAEAVSDDYHVYLEYYRESEENIKPINDRTITEGHCYIKYTMFSPLKPTTIRFNAYRTDYYDDNPYRRDEDNFIGSVDITFTLRNSCNADIYVDATSTESEENGSVDYPYKSLQTALNKVNKNLNLICLMSDITINEPLFVPSSCKILGLRERGENNPCPLEKGVKKVPVIENTQSKKFFNLIGNKGCVLKLIDLRLAYHSLSSYIGIGTWENDNYISQNFKTAVIEGNEYIGEFINGKFVVDVPNKEESSNVEVIVGKIYPAEIVNNVILLDTSYTDLTDITVAIKGKEYPVTLSEGKLRITVNDIESREVSVLVGKKYDAEVFNGKVSIEVPYEEPNVMFVVINGGLARVAVSLDKEEYYPSDIVKLAINISDSDNNPIGNQTIELTFDEESPVLLEDTDGDGIIEYNLNINKKEIGIYDLIVKLKSDIYFNSTVTTKINCTKSPYIHINDGSSIIRGGFVPESNLDVYIDGDYVETIQVDENSNIEYEYNNTEDWYSHVLLLIDEDGNVVDMILIQAKIDIDLLDGETFIKNLAFSNTGEVTYETVTIDDTSKLGDLDGILVDLKINEEYVETKEFNVKNSRLNTTNILYEECLILQNAITVLNRSSNMDITFSRIGEFWED